MDAQQGKSRLAAVDLNLLHALYVLLQEQSVSKAAKRLGLTQPALSNALTRLRGHFGDPLLIRSGREMSLSRMGSELREPLQRMVEQMQQILRVSERFEPSRMQGAMRVMTSDHVDLVLFGFLEAVMRAEAPDLNLHVFPMQGDFGDFLNEDRVEMVIAPNLPMSVHWKSEPLFADRLVCLVRRGHPVLSEVWGVESYVCWPHLLVAPRGVSALGSIDEALEKKGRRRRVARTVPQFSTALFVLLRSDYVLSCPWRLAHEVMRWVEVVMLEVPVEVGQIEMFGIWHQRYERDERHGWFRECVRRAVGQMGAEGGVIRNPPIV
ncbi:LysR family transcriptional regulator [Myxococcota bacterium]|nr:LysR family transcriptional regulator [Myxococcota bacterium]